MTRSNAFLKENRYHYEDIGVSSKISRQIVSLLPPKNSQPVVIVCIGTDRSTGDSLGPLVGTLLKEKKMDEFHIYGTLDDPVHAVNLEENLAHIYNTYNNPFIISIDACLGRLKNIGTIQVNAGPLKPGAGVNKELPTVGDMNIIGIVNVSGFMELLVLQNTRLSVVLKMAKTIAYGIYFAKLTYHKKYTWNEFSQKTNVNQSLPIHSLNEQQMIDDETM